MILIESISIGLFFGFIFYEAVGFSAGGFVVPGYIALYWDRPLMIVSTLFVSFLTVGVLRLLSRVTILYGRRRFILMILVGFGWQWAFRLFVLKTQIINTELDSIGYIIPGLIANEMERQRIFPTVASLLIVSVAVRLTLILLGFLR